MNFAPFLASLDVTNPALFLALAFCAALTTAISKAGFGGAVAIGIPILLLVTTPRIALGVTLPILLVIDVWVLYAMRDKINRQLLVIMTIFGMAGHGIGWAFFDYISNDMLTAFIGGMSVFTTILFFKRQFSPAPQSATASYPASHMWRRGAFWCSLSGISSFISVTGGIPLQIFLLPYQLPRAFYVGTAAAFFFLFKSIKTTAVLGFGHFECGCRNGFGVAVASHPNWCLTWQKDQPSIIRQAILLCASCGLGHHRYKASD